MLLCMWKCFGASNKYIHVNFFQYASICWWRYLHWIQFYHCANSPSMNPATVRLELDIFSIPLSLCRFKWKARYREFVLPCFRRRLNRACSVLYFLINYTSKYDLTISGTVLMLALGKMVLLAGQRSLEKRGRAEKRAIREESSYNSGKNGWTGWLEA